jgi:hypothetical protein
MVALAGAGCAELMGQSEPPARPAETRASFTMPMIELAEGSTAELEKDGVKIIVAAQPFKPVVRERTEVRALDTLFITNDQRPYEIRHIPSIVVTPDELRFKVRVVNNLPHVLKFAGTVLSYTASGKQMPVPKAGYESLLDGIVRPRQEMEFDITGPKTDDLPADTNLSLTLDDVVTATDAAGNPSKRTGFEWIFAVQKKPASKSVAVRTEQVKMTPSEYQTFMAQQQASQAE